MNRSKQIFCLLAFAHLVASAQAQVFSVSDPSQLGFAPDRIQRIDRMLQRLVDEKRIAGAVTLLAREGKVGHLLSVGMANIDEELPMQADTIFRLASMSKPIVSVGAMILFEEGRFQLTDPVSRYIPEFAGTKLYDSNTKSLVEPPHPITIQDLLRHTAGIPYEDEDSTVTEFYIAAELETRNRTLEEMAKKISELPIAFSPGDGWLYGRSTDVLGYLIEEIAKQPLDQFLRKRIFEPLGMIDTGFFVPPEKANRFAMAYVRSENGLLQVSEQKPFAEWLQRPSLLVPGAGLVSTVPDYYRFSQMLLNRGELNGIRILSPTTVDLMVRNHLRDDILPNDFGGPTWDWMIMGWGFGLGFRVLVDGAVAGSAASHGSYGWFGCRNTFFLIDPDEELIGIFMAQADPCEYPGVREFQTLMHQALDR